MWLLNTDTLNLFNFVDNTIPKYAILSHRWESQEVTFRHLYEVNKVLAGADETEGDHTKMLEELNKFPYLSELRTFRLQQLETMQGWKKITRFCSEARAWGFEWGWVDTCCIDKSSSAELQEAVNSMYRWYQNSRICLVYMSDVTTSDASSGKGKLQFENSKWFTRGWTLQELLAPRDVEFLNSAWASLGDKWKRSGEIAAATGIPAKFTSDQKILAQACFAEKMSWVADRETTREEDLVYCLLGMFKVNMPLIYGEGQETAFQRFQKEIFKNTDDDASMFLWNEHFRTAQQRGGLLAMAPSQFSVKETNAIFPLLREFWFRISEVDQPSWEVTRAGTDLRARLIKYKDGRHPPIPVEIKSQFTDLYVCPVISSGDTFRHKCSATYFIILARYRGSVDEYCRIGTWFVDASNYRDITRAQPSSKVNIRNTLGLHDFESGEAVTKPSRVNSAGLRKEG